MTAASSPRRQCLVLLVEDSSETYELYSEVLAKAGYAVVGADNGDDAYRQAVALVPDIIIMDYELRGPASDGCETTERLKQDPRTARTPIVMITGHVSSRDFARARAAGCDAFLAKPIEYKQLLDEVRRRMPPAGPAATGGTVLLVEDDEDIRASVTEILGEEGFRVAVAVNGAEALRWLRAAAEPPRLILLDLMMPVMDGWAFRAAQLVDERLARIPVVILSAATDVRGHAAKLGADSYLVKPLDVPQLLHAVERHV